MTQSPHPVETVSDERLAEMLGAWQADAARISADMNFHELEVVSALTELLSRRSLDTADRVDETPFGHEYGEGPKLMDVVNALEASRPSRNAEMVVKTLEWGAGDEAVTPFGTYRVVRTDDGYALTFEHEELVHIGFNAVEPFQSPRNEAMGRAQPDFDQRIRSALAITEPERGGEPAGRDARAEILMGIATTLRRTAEMTNAPFQNFYAAQADACEAGAVAITLASPPAQEAVTDAQIDAALTARVPGGSEVWHWIAGGGKAIQTIHRDVMRCAVEALHPSSKRG